jgi:hypothetical protein
MTNNNCGLKDERGQKTNTRERERERKERPEVKGNSSLK